MEVCPLNFDLTACLQDVVGFFRPFQNWSHRKKKKSQLETGGWGTIHHISLFDAAPENSNLFVMPKMYGLLRNGHIMPHWRGNVGKYYSPIWDGWDTSLKSMCGCQIGSSSPSTSTNRTAPIWQSVPSIHIRIAKQIGTVLHQKKWQEFRHRFLYSWKWSPKNTLNKKQKKWSQHASFLHVMHPVFRCQMVDRFLMVILKTNWFRIKLVGGFNPSHKY